MTLCLSVGTHKVRVDRDDIKKSPYSRSSAASRLSIGRCGLAAQDGASHDGRGTSLSSVLSALPPKRVKTIFCSDYGMLRSLVMTSTAIYSLLRTEYFWTGISIPYPVKTRMHLAELGLESGIEKRIPIPLIMALANAYLTGRCSKRQLVTALELLSEGGRRRLNDSDFAQLGLKEAARLIGEKRFMLDAWAIAGLMNGIIDPHDYASIRPGRGIATPAFWTRRFPGMGAGSPVLTMQDLRYIGVHTPTSVEAMRVGPLREKAVLLEGTSITNVHDLGETLAVYCGDIHYLLGIIAARVSGKSAGPLGGDPTREALYRSFQAAFGMAMEAAKHEKPVKALDTFGRREFCNLV